MPRAMNHPNYVYTPHTIERRLESSKRMRRTIQLKDAAIMFVKMLQKIETASDGDFDEVIEKFWDEEKKLRERIIGLYPEEFGLSPTKGRLMNP